MKKVGFYLAHPAHFHLFKHVINALLTKGCKVRVVYNEKDVLHELIQSSEFKDHARRVRANKKVNSKLSLLLQFALKNLGAFIYFLQFRPQVVVGTPVLISLIGRILPYKSILVNEDDFDIVSRTADLGYPYADSILCPEVCRTTTFEAKSVKYNGYHELAYLHPNNFKPDQSVANAILKTSEPYFIIRFAKLTAHHDEGISGLSKNLALRLIKLLEPHGRVYITSERELEPELESYRIVIQAKDMHHVIAFASFYIGDSQTMAAEAGVLGVPFIRFNDFVGRISYLDELENKYELGYGILPSKIDELYARVTSLLELNNRKEEFQLRKEKMLSEKIDYAQFLTWFIENYPKSKKELRKNPDYQYRFK